MAMTKADIVDSLSKRIEVPRRRSVEVVEIMLEVVKKTLENGEDVLISGFGKFCVRDKAQQRGRNPQTENRLGSCELCITSLGFRESGSVTQVASRRRIATIAW
jgi:integration host factor subunit alpha